MEIKRIIINKLIEEFSEPKVSILLGARQVGKTTILRQLEAVARGMGRKTAYYDLESSANLAMLSGSREDVITKLLSSGDVVFIDEFHYLENASKIFKAIYDQGAPIKIFASGSSSLEMHRHLKESLAGRFFKTMIFPLALSEHQRVPNATLDEYLMWGGMPGLVHCRSNEDKARLLENIVDTYITKDIKGLIKEENVRSFNAMLYLLAQQQGSLVVKSELAREIGVSEPTVARHIEILSQTYVCHVLHSYSGNLANELKKSIKVYLFDIGIRNSMLKDFRAPSGRDDKGALYETFVHLHLVPQLKPNMEVRFWRTKRGEEVDFVLVKNRIPVPVEVKSSMGKAEVPSGLRAFLQAYPKAPFGIVFCDAQRESVEVGGRPVHLLRWEQSEDVEYLRNVLG